MLSQDEVLRQSKGAMKQWEETWRKHAVENGQILKDRGYSNQVIFGHGVGRKAICVAYSPGLEDSVEDLKVKNDSVDILCVDKAMSYLLDHGVKPTFVFLADAGISYEKWCKPYIDQSEDMILMMNVTANAEWARNWKGKIFYFVNQDNIQTEKIFMPLSGCNELVKASSNVGNSVLVYAGTYLHYDEYYLVGYEFCWSDDDNYYCGEDSDKRWYMNHHQLLNTSGNMVNTSQNLLFSARWLNDFVNAILRPAKKNIYTCSKKGIIHLPYYNLKKLLKDAKPREIKQKEMDMVLQNRLQTIRITAQEGAEKLQEALSKHQVFDVLVRHLPRDIMEAI